MTKETRVGLLLGLGFIIAFGMILSELREDPPAVSNDKEKPLLETTYYRTEPVSVEEIAFGPAEQPPMRTFRDRPAGSDPVARETAHVAPETPAPVLHSARILRETVDPGQPDFDPPAVEEIPEAPRVAERPAVSQPAVAVRTYTVENNDSLYTIAGKFYGPNNSHLFKRIYEANRDRLTSAETVRVGQVLVIPPLPGSGSRPSASSSRGVRQVDLAQLRQHVTSPARARGAAKIYVVQRGDNLTRIARKMFKDSSLGSVNRIYEANRDQLENRDSLSEGMRLRIPS